MATAKQSVWWAVALLGPPAGFAAFILVAYRIALSNGHLPFLHGLSFWYVAFGVCLAGGVAALTVARGKSAQWKIALALAYVPPMTVFLLIAHLVAACGSGDCL